MCKHCKDAIPIVDGKYLGLTIFYSREGNNAYIRGYDKDGWNTSELLNFNYCPMCGRNLKEEKELYSFYE